MSARQSGVKTMCALLYRKPSPVVAVVVAAESGIDANPRTSSVVQAVAA